MGFIRKHDEPKGQIIDINEYRGRKKRAQIDASHNPSPSYKSIDPLEEHYQSQVNYPKMGVRRPGLGARFTAYSGRIMDYAARKLELIKPGESLFDPLPEGHWMNDTVRKDK